MLFRSVIYAFISELNPLIYLNFLVLIVLLFALIYIIHKALRYAKSRNTKVDLIVGLIICFLAWYAHWCFYFVKYEGGSITFFTAFFNPAYTFEFIKNFTEARVITLGRIGSSSGGAAISGIVLKIFYVIEFLCFMLFYIASRKPQYFSEEQQCFYTSVEKYVENNDHFADSFEKASPGYYNFLSQMEIYSSIMEIPLEQHAKVVKLDFYYCDEKKDDSILTMTEGTLKVSKNKKKKESNFSASKILIKGMYVDAETDAAILREPDLTTSETTLSEEEINEE